MIPVNLITEDTGNEEAQQEPGLTFGIVNGNRIAGFIDDIEAVKQAVEAILSTERYQYYIYSWDYGVEFEELIGEDPAYCCPEISRRIQDALLQDERITSVDGWHFEQEGHSITVSFTVHSIYGDIEKETEVSV